ncbi:hypothetical protein G6F37_003576 [Rhizopus arrhizus]|nr:hypothetical protein G6F38_009504 [Rhizopus arrhizus]KAG1160884.1 hypothetical protein G6F37_003576 [Rhizopus arrhizus]
MKTIGPGKKELDAATIRTNFPIRPQCGIYYFEIKVISKGEDGFICIGFCRAANKLERLPGWDAHSYAYHADDGHIFDQCGQGKDYGPSFSTGDTIGCCINYANKTAFFTKNGVFLGVAFKNINLSESFYPCVGLRTPGEKVYVNFGQEPFVFDIAHYVKEMKHEVLQDLIQKEHAVNHNSIDQLVLDYLVHHGYLNTANSLQKNINYMKQDNKGKQTFFTNTNIETRSSIRRSLLAGKVDEAIQQIETGYPELLKQNPRLLFQLKSQKLIEMINDSLRHSTDIQSQVLYEEEDPQSHFPNPPTPHPPPVSASASGRRLSWAAIAATPTHPTFERRSSNASSIHSFDYFDEEHNYIKKAMHYGQKLQEKYSTDPNYSTTLSDISSLLAYPNPTTSPVAHLLNKSARDSLASDVNAAIQLYQHEQEASSLEKVYKQVVVTIEQLTLSGHGQASLIQPNSV